MVARRDQLLTSWLTVGEALTKPKESGNAVLEKSYLNFFTSGSIQLIPFEADAAKQYAKIRASQRVRPEDAIQLACAAAANTDLFVTNDSRLSDLVISGITFVTGIGRIPY
jgi:predicted nucleic acid-binding protein